MTVKALLVLPFLATAMLAQAGGTPLAPGQSLGSVPQTFSGGLTLLESRTEYLQGIDNSINLLRYEAELRSSVYRGADGKLSFGYELYSFYPGNTVIDQLDINGLAPYTIAVEQAAARPNDGYFASGGVSRTANGNVVSFLLRDNGEAGTGAVGEYQGLVSQVLQTNAVSYGYGTASSLGGGVGTSTLAFVPVGDPVPEPATLAVLGFGALAALRRRKS